MSRRIDREESDAHADGAGDAQRSGEEAAESTSTVGVEGERGIPAINRVRSVQSRVSSALTIGLMSVIAAGLLLWYYSGAIHRNDRAQSLAQAAQKRRAQGDSSLPSLGPITPPRVGGDRDSALARLLGGPPPMTSAPEIPLATANPYASTAATPKTPGQLAWERRLAGPVLSKVSTAMASPAGSTAEAGIGGLPPGIAPAAGNEAAPTASEGDSDLASLLRPTATPAVRARLLPTQRFLLPKGAFIDCTLETAINSSLPGMTTCVTATDTFSADGDVVLLERGTKLVGETRGQVQQGSPRLFVLWTEARSPTGVVVPLASPGTDELGRSGLTGSIDRHWWQRFGAAILITVIDGTIQGVTQSRGSGSTFVYNPSSSSGVVTEVLKDTLRIAPTIDKPQGDRIQILVARDVDFRSVYALRATASNP